MTKQNRTILLPSDLFFFVVDCYLGFPSFLKQKDCKNIFILCVRMFYLLVCKYTTYMQCPQKAVEGDGPLKLQLRLSAAREPLVSFSGRTINALHP